MTRASLMRALREPLADLIFLLAVFATRWAAGFEWAVMLGLAFIYGKVAFTLSRPAPTNVVNISEPLESFAGDRAVLAAIQRNRTKVKDIIARQPFAGDPEDQAHRAHRPTP